MENSSVKIYLRVRPAQIWEAVSPAKTYIDLKSSSKQMIVIENTPHAFDNVFYHSSTQEEVFERIEPSVEHLINGFNSCCFAYGQSGTGKTYTMGLNEKNNPGLITLSLDSLFEKLNKLTDPVEHEVSISYVEIYNDKVYDLLDDAKNNESIFTKGKKYAGSSKIAIQNSNDAKKILAKGNKNRHVRSTIINATSSRSHAMFSIFLKMRKMNSETASVFHLVDLAGSEGIRNTGHTGIAQQEGIQINHGLLAIGKVIQALNERKKVIPYRESALTIVLENCLNLNSYLNLIACISPARKDKSETLSTIRFARSCKSLDSKVLPEMNAYLKQQQRLQARTPLKSYMNPVARNETSKTPGKSLPKTPARITLTANRATGTIKKQPLSSVNRYRSFNTPSKRSTAVDPARYSEFPQTSDISYVRHAPASSAKESLDNQTFNIMNVSSSTEFEGPSMSAHPSVTNLAQPAMPSFSPLLRQIESTIDKKLTLFMNSFINQTTSAPAASADMTNNDEVAQNLRNDLRDAVMNGIEEMRETSANRDNNETSGMENSTFEVPDYAVSSTVMRKPTQVKEFYGNDGMELMPPPARRTNRRLLTTELEVPPSPLRVSNSFNQTVLPAPRRSRRITMMKEIRSSKENVLPILKEKTQKSKIKNKVVASYFDKSSSAMKHVTKKDHKEAILDLLNTGTVKEIQVLPTIGAKTAYRIITNRTVKGKFETLDDVNKSLMMTQKSWNKFLEANLLN